MIKEFDEKMKNFEGFRERSKTIEGFEKSRRWTIDFDERSNTIDELL